MKVYRGEGLAIHTSPKPCAMIREDHGEASVGKTRKPAIVPRKLQFRVPTKISVWKATPTATITRVAVGPCVVGDPGERGSLLQGNRERSRPTSDAGPHREGACVEADDARS